jgi:hypothetical protein
VKRRTVHVAVVIPDASPILTLSRVGRLDVLSLLQVPIKIVDQVMYEITKPENDPTGAAAAGLNLLHNQIEIVETYIGLGFQARKARGSEVSGRNLGEIAVDEYATRLAHTTPPSFVPLVLFEDPDVHTLRIARLDGVHLINTSAFLLTLSGQNLVKDADAIIRQINETRASPMTPFEKPAKTAKIISNILKRPKR